VTENETELRLGDYLRIISRRWRLITLIVALGLALAVITTQNSSRVYKAQSSIIVRNSQNDSLFIGLGDAGSTLLRETTAELQFVRGDGFREAVAAKVSVPVRITADIRAVSDIERVPGASGVIILAASSDTAEAAVGVANAAAATYVELRHADDLTENARQIDLQQSELDSLILERADLRAPLMDIEAKIATASGDELGALLNASTREQRRIAGDLNRLDTSITDLEGSLLGLKRVQRALDDPESAARVLTKASTRSAGSSSGLVRNLALAAIASLILAIAAVQIAESLDDNLSDPDEIERRIGAPILGTVPVIGGSRRDRADPARTSFSSLTITEAESYRSIRTSLRFLGVENPLRVIQITSSLESEGKSLTAVNLASAFAAEGDRVVVVDADLRRPAIHERASVENRLGVSDVVADLADLESVITKAGPGLWVVTAGRNPPNPADLLGGSRFRTMLESLREKFDLVVVDSPPVLPVVDSRMVAARVDAVLMVVNHHKTPGHAAESAAELLRASRATIAGVVVNRSSSAKTNYDYVATGYGEHEFADKMVSDRWDQTGLGPDQDQVADHPHNVVDIGTEDSSGGGRSASR